MKYYRLSKSTEKKIIGDYPSVERNPNQIDYNFAAEYSIRNLRLFQTMEGIRFPEMSIKYKAKVIDVLDMVGLTSYSNLLISKNFYDCLSSFKIPEFEIQPLTLAKRSKTFTFQFLHFVESMDRLIDFPQSRYNRQISPRKVIEENLVFSDYEDFMKKREKVAAHNATFEGLKHAVKAKKLHINNPNQYDLIIGRSLYGVYIISERFAEVLNNSDIVGMDITPIEEYKKIEITVT